MRNRKRQGVFGVVLAVAAGCGPAAVDQEPQRCLTLQEPAGSDGLLVSAPARISLFFSVDTCGGEPVSGLEAASFTVSEDGKAISAFESQRTIRPKGQRYQMNSLLLLDLSGSVLRSGQFGALKDAAERYVRAVLERPEDGQRVAIMTFDGRAAPTRLVDFTGDVNALLGGLASLETPMCTTSADCAGQAEAKTCAAWRCVDDSTNLNGALLSGLDALDAQLEANAAVNWRDAALIVFTDGTDQAARVPQETALTRARTTRTHVFTVGLGGEVDEGALRAFGKDGYWRSDDPEGLAQSFEAIASRVVGMANRFYLLEYCSPKRSGKHTLKVTATFDDGGKTPLIGGLSRDFDATGFTSGCELGVQ